MDVLPRTLPFGLFREYLDKQVVSRSELQLEPLRDLVQILLILPILVSDGLIVLEKGHLQFPTLAADKVGEFVEPSDLGGEDAGLWVVVLFVIVEHPVKLDGLPNRWQGLCELSEEPGLVVVGVFIVS